MALLFRASYTTLDYLSFYTMTSGILLDTLLMLQQEPHIVGTSNLVFYIHIFTSFFHIDSKSFHYSVFLFASPCYFHLPFLLLLPGRYIRSH
jgi:hypothetical protein